MTAISVQAVRVDSLARAHSTQAKKEDGSDVAEQLNVKPEEMVDCLTISRLTARDLPIEDDENRLLFCSFTVTDGHMGKKTLKTKGIKTSGPASWQQELEFHRYHGSPKEMLLSIEVFLRAWHSRRRQFVGSLTLDVQDEDLFDEDAPQWQRLFDVNGALMPSLLRIHLGRKKRLAKEIRAEQRRKWLRYLSAFAFLASVLCAILFPVLWPRGCDAECRGQWEEELPLPSQRSNFGATLHMSRLYVIGGCCDLDTVYSLGVGERQWQLAPPLPSARMRLGTGSVQGEMFAVGGLGESGVFSFDGSVWRARTQLPALHPWVQAASSGVGGLCVLGRTGGAGNMPVSLGGDSYYNQSMFCWEPATETWTRTTTVPTDRHSYSVAAFQGAIVVLGGWQHGPSRVVEAFDGQGWTRLPGLLEARYAFAAAQSGDRLFACGGSDGYSTLRSLESFDGGSWRSESPMSEPRQYHAAIAFHGRLFVLGGSRVGQVGQIPADTASVESFAFRED